MAQDDEITSEALDSLLDLAESLDTTRPIGGTDVGLYMRVDAETLRALELRAASEGADVSAVAAEALRAAVRAA